MAPRLETLLCYWDGETKMGSEGIEYEGPPPRALRVHDNMKLNELKEKIYGVTGWDNRQYELEIACRYLVIRNPNKYIALPIVDDGSVSAMFAMISDAVRCTELYLKKKLCPQVPASPICTSRPYTQNSTTDLNVCTIPSSYEGVTRHTHQAELQGVHPGPDTLDVLHLQKSHRSEDIWGGQLNLLLHCRHHIVWPLNETIRPLVQDAGFYGLCHIGHISIDWALITSLVERWRQETHTFHLPVGEMTVTLQDVALLLGLRIDGLPVSGVSHHADEWPVLCERLLGIRPEAKDISGSSLRLRWLSTNFSAFPKQLEGHHDADIIKAHHARAYILYLFGAVLFPDTSGDTVPLLFLPLLEDLPKVRDYSWGSATLAHLYRSLCRACQKTVRQIGGNLLLLQLWAWERLHVGRPNLREARVPQMPVRDTAAVEGDEGGDEIVHVEPAHRPPLGARWREHKSFIENPSGVLVFFRDQLDQQADHQVIWQPYTNDRLRTVPPICLDGQHLWRARVPLICFAFIEWHFPDRVMRQFGKLQHIPDPCDTIETLHSIDRRGRRSEDWLTYHTDFIKLWEQRSDHVVGQRTDELDATKCYMTWYQSITRRRIGPPTQHPSRLPLMQYEPSGSITHALIEGIISIARRCASALHDTSDDIARAAFTEVMGICRSTMDHIGQQDRLERELGKPGNVVGGRSNKSKTRDRKIDRRGRGRGREQERGEESVLALPCEDFTIAPSQLTRLGALSFAAHEAEARSLKTKKRRTARH